MSFEHTWRWFGPNDPVTLDEIRQIGVTGIVTSLHHIPVGEIWPADKILKRKKSLENKGLNWSVVESLPVHEDIKKGSADSSKWIENYKQSIKNLAECNIRTVCYNFMPVLDWSRTGLDALTEEGTKTTKFESFVLAAFDLFILERADAEKDYTPDIIEKAKNYFEKLGSKEKDELIKTVLFALPGSLETISLKDFKNAVTEYNSISEAQVRENLYSFLKEIIPVAEEHDVFFAIHPDDPPWTILGLPRVAGNMKDLEMLLNAYDSPSNGITLCTGSLGAGFSNDLPEIVKKFSHRVNFIHLRSLERDSDGNFTETSHLEGDLDLYTVMKELLMEQKRRQEKGKKDFKIPMRPDHGALMLFEKEKEGIYPGYSLLGRMKGLAELRGMELGIKRSLDI